MIQATSVNCSPIKPTSFKRSESRNVEVMEDAAEFIKTADLKNVDEDTMDRLKNIVENIEVDKDSKVMGPLKTFLLSGITLATGTLLSKGTANKLFYLVKDKGFAQKCFAGMGKSLTTATESLARKAEAAESLGKFKKYSLKGLNYIAQELDKFATKGTTAAVDSKDFLIQKAEKVTKAVSSTIGSVFGLTTTGAALAVDKDGNGRSDVLEIRDKKREQKAVTELAAAVLDAI